MEPESKTPPMGTKPHASTPPPMGSKAQAAEPPPPNHPTEQQARTHRMDSKAQASTPPLMANLVTEQQARTHPMGSKAATPPPAANFATEQQARTRPLGSNAQAPTHSLVANWLSTSVELPQQKRPPHSGRAGPMVDEQRKIHPVAVEAKAEMKKPLVAKGPSKSGEPNSAQQQGQQRPFTLREAVNQPIPYPNPQKKKSSLCRWICWIAILLILILVALGVTIGILYAVFRPKVPNYSVNSLRISNLGLNFDLSLYAQFNVKITATNPNKKIGIYYQKGSRLSVWYSKTKLCQGTLPVFYQGHQNTTRLDVGLSGQNQFGSTLLSALQQQQQTGRIPLDLKVDVPVSIKLGKMKLRKVRILGTCLLIVDSLSANTLVSIKASTCKFRVKL